MSDPQKEWFVRLEDKTYGPVSFSTLHHWAAQGNLNAAAQLSPSREGPWSPAGDLQGLELDWQLEDEEGAKYHACHILALREEVAQGNIQPFWTVHHLPTGESYPLVDALCSALLEQNRILEEQLVKTYARMRDLETIGTEAPALVSGAAPKSQAEWSALMRSSDQHQKEAEKWKRIYEDEVSRNQAREAELGMQIEDLRDQLRRAGERVRSLERRRDQLEEMALGPDGQSVKSQDRELREAYQELREQMDQLFSSLHLKDQELESAWSRIRKAEEALKTERDRVAAERAASETRQQEARTHLIRLEQAHRDLTRAYRDLNERLIRLRNQTEAPNRIQLNRDAGNSTTALPRHAPLPAPSAETAAAPGPGRMKIKLT